MKTSKVLRQEMNQLGATRSGFAFWIDAQAQYGIISLLNKPCDGFYYELPRHKHLPPQVALPSSLIFQKHPIPFEVYEKSFQHVQAALTRGDSYLLNLCFSTNLTTNLTLEHFFIHAQARYKALISGYSVSFSPECFVQIKNGNISTYPMKGTIKADHPNAAEQLLANEKEACEHATVVDLLRNDLSRVSHSVQVKRYRYLDKVQTQQGDLWQSSSEITGVLPDDWPSHIADILFPLLPAGSVTGAPKASTCEIISESEHDDRGFYSGIFGIFDGESLESAIAIRYVEQTKQGLIYRSGGGITTMSNAREEYDEMIAKVYLPFPANPAPL